MFTFDVEVESAALRLCQLEAEHMNSTFITMAGQDDRMSSDASSDDPRTISAMTISTSSIPNATMGTWAIDSGVMIVVLLCGLLTVLIIGYFYCVPHKYIWQLIENKILKDNIGLNDDFNNGMCNGNTSKHAILDSFKYGVYDKYYKSLNRSNKCYLKRCDNLLKRNNIVFVEKAATMWYFTLNHFEIIYNHQKRIVSQNDNENENENNNKYWYWFTKMRKMVVPFLLSLKRALKIIFMMKGKIIEYYVCVDHDTSDKDTQNGMNSIYADNDGHNKNNGKHKAKTKWNGKRAAYDTCDNKSDRKLIGFCQLIGKGETLRAMWFYQNSDYCKCNLWFHCMKLSLIETFNNDNLRYIDLGPSKTDSIAQNKERFGFINYNNWIDMCNYNGKYTIFNQLNNSYS